VSYTAAWAGLYAHNNSPVSASDFVELRFWTHGGAAGGQEIQVSAVDAAFTWSPAIAITPPLAGAWTEVTLPITSFGLATIGGLVWQDASGGPQPTYYLDDIALIAGEPPDPGTGPALAVDVALDRHPISPFIYGMNFADPAFAAEIALPVNRFGGNATTRFNWQNDTSNRASDWFFENIPNDNPNPGTLPHGSSSDQIVDANLVTGTDSLLTLPLIGWTPKSRQYACGYSVAEYGAQEQVDPWRPDCGNGILTNGTPITWNDPADTSLAISPAFVQGWVNHLIGRYGRADEGGVRFYCLDNEPIRRMGLVCILLLRAGRGRGRRMVEHPAGPAGSR
jgi:hypothetical protein